MERNVRVWVDAFGGKPCRLLRQEDVDAHIAEDMSELRPNTIAKMVRVVKAVMNDAHGRGLIEAVPRLRCPTFFDERDEHLTGDEVDALLKWLIANKGPVESLAIGTLIYTGVRVNELTGLKGSDFRPFSLLVRKKQGKTRDTRSIPYAGTYYKLFKPHMLNACGGDFVFKSVAISPAAMSDKLRRVLREGLDAMGVTRNVRVHDLRHTFAFLCGSAGVDLGDLQLLLGHSNVAMTMRYRGFINSRAKEVLDGM